MAGGEAETDVKEASGQMFLQNRDLLSYAARRQYELIAPPSFEVQTMLLTRTPVASSEGIQNPAANDRGRA